MIRLLSRVSLRAAIYRHDAMYPYRRWHLHNIDGTYVVVSYIRRGYDSIKRGECQTPLQAFLKMCEEVEKT